MLCPVVVRIDADAEARVVTAVRVRIEIVMSRGAE
jgi:hypothetical protein